LNWFTAAELSQKNKNGKLFMETVKNFTAINFSCYP